MAAPITTMAAPAISAPVTTMAAPAPIMSAPMTTCRLNVSTHCFHRCCCSRAHVSFTAWHLTFRPLDTCSEKLGRRFPHECVLLRRSLYQFAAQKADYCLYHRLNRFHVLGVHSLQVRLRERLPVNICWPWIGDVLDNLAKVLLQLAGSFFLSLLRIRNNVIERCQSIRIRDINGTLTV